MDKKDYEPFTFTELGSTKEMDEQNCESPDEFDSTEETGDSEYEPPELTEFGSIEELTEGGKTNAGNDGDMGSGQGQGGGPGGGPGN